MFSGNGKGERTLHLQKRSPMLRSRHSAQRTVGCQSGSVRVAGDQKVPVCALLVGAGLLDAEGTEETLGTQYEVSRGSQSSHKG